MTCFEKCLTSLPNLGYFMRRILHIPCGWWITEEDIVYIVKIIKEFLDEEKIL